jgi:membrane-bound lytic murein transglycosylase F
VQESKLDPNARSAAGAEGIAQFMPKSWADITRQLGWSGVSANQAGPAITAAAYYMMKLRAEWRRNRPILESHRLAQASYNAGLGSILAAQRLCQNAVLWETVQLCLPDVTGLQNSSQTVTYVTRIAYWRTMLEN